MMNDVAVLSAYACEFNGFCTDPVQRTNRYKKKGFQQVGLEPKFRPRQILSQINVETGVNRMRNRRCAQQASFEKKGKTYLNCV